MNQYDLEYLRESREASRQEMYRDLAGTYDRHPLSPRAEGIQRAKDAGITRETPETDEEDER